MDFTDYFIVIKEGFSKNLSNEDLCNTLFDSVVIPLDLRGKQGDVYTIDKSNVSKILNRKEVIPGKIRNNIYDEQVLNSIENYFEDNIMPFLSQHIDEVVSKMHKLIKIDDTLSSYEKSSFQMMINSKKYALFLSQAFIYVVRKTDKENMRGSEDEKLTIRTIDSSNALISDLAVFKFTPKEKYTFIEYSNLIKNLVEDIESIQIASNTDLTEAFSLNFSFEESVTFTDMQRMYIERVTKKLEIDLSESFFDIGRLRRKAMFQTSFMSNGNNQLIGSNDEIEKYNLIIKLYDLCVELVNWLEIEIEFEKYYCIKSVLTNNSYIAFENVIIEMEFPKDEYVTIRELSKIKKSRLDNLIDHHNPYVIFGIPKAINYLAYDESKINKVMPYFEYPDMSFLGIKRERNYEEALESYFPYFVQENSNTVIIQLKVDEIMPYSSVAFPSIILLKNEIDSVNYKIKAKELEYVINGTIKKSGK